MNQIKYITNYLIISSKNRDTSIYPNVNQYSINFDEYRYVKSIELIQAILPDKNSITSEPYLVLEINELNDTINSNDIVLSRAFNLLYLNKPDVDGTFIKINGIFNENIIKYFDQPKLLINKLSISIKKEDGSLFDFGNDTNPPSKALQNTFVFKIITCNRADIVSL